MNGVPPPCDGPLSLLVQRKRRKERTPEPSPRLSRGPFRVLEKAGRSLTRTQTLNKKTIECLGCLGQELALIPVFLRYSARADGIKTCTYRSLRFTQRHLPCTSKYVSYSSTLKFGRQTVKRYNIPCRLG